MTNIIIIEDEIPARKKIRRMLEEMDTAVEIIAEIDTVAGAISMLPTLKADLIISDVELLDGNAFEIYRQVPVTCPVIFTTAYDRFWMDAFEANGIAYLLKPFPKDKFKKAWEKFLLFGKAADSSQVLLAKLTQFIEQQTLNKTYRKHFTAQRQQSLYFIDTANIGYFEARAGLVYAHDITGQKHLLTESTLKEIEDQLDPAEFFRLNRSELVNKGNIEKLERDGKTISVKMKGSEGFLISSQSSTASFRNWVGI